MTQTALYVLSWNTRDDYKANIYHAICVNEWYILHFRYRKDFVDRNSLAFLGVEKPSSDRLYPELQWMKALIIHPIKENGLWIFHTDVRWGKITKCEYTNDTELLHVYVRIEWLQDNRKLIYGSDFFFGIGTLENNHSSYLFGWKNALMNLREKNKEDFNDKMFFRILKLEKSTSFLRNSTVKWENTPDAKGGFFRVKPGGKYLLHINISKWREKGKNGQLYLKSSSDFIVLCLDGLITSEMDYDNIIIPIYVRKSATTKDYAFISIDPISSDCNSSYAVKFEFKIMHNSVMLRLYALAWSFLLLLGTLWEQIFHLGEVLFQKLKIFWGNPIFSNIDSSYMILSLLFLFSILAIYFLLKEFDERR